MNAARVFNPVVLKMRASPAISRNLPCGSQLKRIKRDLFGSSNSTETCKIFNEELDKHQERANKKWSFDFRAGCPLSANSQYIWERVGCQESSYVPEMYTLTRAAHVRPLDASVEPSEMDTLMDERAERENTSMSTDNESCYDSQDESMTTVSSAFKLPERRISAPASSLSVSSVAMHLLQQRIRQAKITDYMKERKRLVQTPKKLSPSGKRVRTSSGSSSSSSHSTASIGIHCTPFKRQRNN